MKFMHFQCIVLVQKNKPIHTNSSLSQVKRSRVGKRRGRCQEHMREQGQRIAGSKILLFCASYNPTPTIIPF